MDKREMRQQALRARRTHAPEEEESLSGRGRGRQLARPQDTRAGTVATYVAKKDEVQTDEVIRSALSSGKRVLAPRTNPDSSRLDFCEIKALDDLVPGQFGVLEPPETSAPVPLARAQLVLVPVVAWDEKGGRIGYGKGYFDRELRHRGRALSVGLAFESQRVEEVPATQLDVPLDVFVTEKRTLILGRPLDG